MATPIDLNQLLENNPGVDPERLRKALEMARKLRRRQVAAGRYRYNLIAPFAGKLHRQQSSAEAGGEGDNVRKGS